ncbi:MAG TPA: RES domain-containing protein [Steroidobacteraceae bacterium]|nr:RES domain-containing protein [Steroidobacteraceae bacterium]
MRLYRARAVRGAGARFDPLDASGSVAGPLGWRFNDPHTPILYTAEREALAVLEVAVRPGWESVREVLIAPIELPDDSVADLADLGIELPPDWSARPAAPAARRLARLFLERAARRSPRPLGVRVPSVLSTSDCNVLLDPSRLAACRAGPVHRLAFKALLATRS